MKSFLFAVVMLAQISVFAVVKKEACRLKADKQSEIDSISSNIAKLSKVQGISVEKEIQKMVEANRIYEKAALDCPMSSEEACAAAYEKKKRYDYLVSRITKDPTADIDAVISEIKKTSLAYKDLNSQCKK